MARRRRKRRSLASVVALVVVGAAVFAVGLWLGRSRLSPPRPPVEGRAPRAAPRPRAAAPSPPAAPRTEVRPPREPEPAARIAIVIDDLGRSLEEAERVLALDTPVSCAVLPFEPRTAEVAERLRAGGAEVLVHLPMEPEGGEDPGPGAVTEELPRGRIARRTERAIDAVPGAVGLNNHMGSRATADARTMEAVLGVVAERGLFFLDSRTTAETEALDWARAHGVPATQRDVFLDDDPAAPAVAQAFARLLELARERGAAVAIGHPHAATLEVLAEELPAARAAGFEVVPVSYLLERSESLPE